MHDKHCPNFYQCIPQCLRCINSPVREKVSSVAVLAVGISSTWSTSLLSPWEPGAEEPSSMHVSKRSVTKGMLWRIKGLITMCQLQDVTLYTLLKLHIYYIYIDRYMTNVTHLDKNAWGRAKTQVTAMQ